MRFDFFAQQLRASGNKFRRVVKQRRTLAADVSKQIIKGVFMKRCENVTLISKAHKCFPPFSLWLKKVAAAFSGSLRLRLPVKSFTTGRFRADSAACQTGDLSAAPSVPPQVSLCFQNKKTDNRRIRRVGKKLCLRFHRRRSFPESFAGFGEAERGFSPRRISIIVGYFYSKKLKRAKNLNLFLKVC
jgi:hypothetical protein